MNDFQGYLKLYMESDVGKSASPTAVNLEDAKTPTEAYLAYRHELQALWQPLEALLTKADQQLQALGGHMGTHFEPAKTQADIKTHVASFAPKTARPTIDRSKIASMVDKYRTPPAGTTPSPQGS